VSDKLLAEGKKKERIIIIIRRRNRVNTICLPNFAWGTYLVITFELAWYYGTG
jgi:hypothetical protein